MFADGMLIRPEWASSASSDNWTLAAYSLTDGSLTWTQKTGDFPLLYGATTGLVFYLHSVDGHAAPDTLIAAHTRDGSRAWTVALPGYASVDGDVSHLCFSFSGQTTQITYLASADGKAAWSHSWPSSAQLQTSASAPVVYQNAVHVGVTTYDANRDPTLPSTVYALSTTDGATLWRQTITGLLSFPVETHRL